MRYQPKTEEQLQDEGLLPDGNYPFEVVGATNKQSKKGNDMIELNLRFYGADGRPVFVRDWLMEAMGFKLRHFCEEVGLLDKYNSGELNDTDCEGKTGFATVKKEPAKGDFGPKNAVKDYGKKEEAEPVAAPAGSADLEKDDIPF